MNTKLETPKTTIIRGPGRPTRYLLADGKTRVPGVTTIVNRFKDSGGLIHWAWTQGTEGKDYRNTRDDAADTGKIAHQWIEDYIHGSQRTQFPNATNEQIAGAESGLMAFLDWATQNGLEVIATELPLISEKHRFGGTLDAVAKVAGKVVLLDWKTSNGVYADYIGQVAAYRELLRENATALGGAPAPESAQLLRFGKEFGDFHAHSYPEQVLDAGWRAFSLMRELYDLDGRLKKVAA
jgi:hypothetical protein